MPVPKQYLGHLSSHDPLHLYLVQDVLPQIGVRNGAADFRVFSMKDSKVYLYEERHSCAQVVGKFFVSGGHRTADAIQRMRQEFDNLQLLRGYGLAGYPHHVVRPLGTNACLNSILVEEYAKGVPLSAFVNEAIHQGQSQPLFDKLTALAYFLATLHNRTANGQGVDFHQDCAYLDRLVRKLRSKQVIGAEDADELTWLRDRWREKPRPWDCPRWLPSIAMLSLGTAPGIAFLLVRASFYEVAISAGYCFVMAGFLLTAHSLLEDSPRTLSLIGAGLCFGLAAGCRPNLAVLAILMALLVGWRTRSYRVRALGFVAPILLRS